MDKFMASEKVLLGGDFDGHVGSNIGGFGEVHGGGSLGVWFGLSKEIIEGLDCWIEQLVQCWA